MKFIKILLLPISILYGCIVFLRNKFYDNHLLSSKSFELPIISVGNLSMGGTGKSPHIEYILRLLNAEFKTATLSRGYGRKTDGFLVATENSTADEIGDEPMQFAHKFKNCIVAVDAKRVRGITNLQQQFPFLNLILLDDAFQHRAVKAGLSILLTDCSHLYTDDFMLPTGTLREIKAGAKRADIIIVTKCKSQLSDEERKEIVSKIKPLAYQQVYFSKIKYGNLVSVWNDKNNSETNLITSETTVLLVTGIANPKPMDDYLKSKTKHIVPLKYSDHYSFRESDINEIVNLFNGISSKNKIAVTTEKDFMRLKSSPFIHLLKNIPLNYLPIEIDFADGDKQEFDGQILNYVSGK